MRPTLNVWCWIALGCLITAGTAVAKNEVVVIANPETPTVTENMVQKVFLGKIVEVNGAAVIPVNLVVNAPARQVFMTHVMGDGEEKYTSYWTVRRYIGKGAPPREFSSAQDLIDYIRDTPGAIGYVNVDVPTGALKVLFKRP
ncbi:MAG: hypothetical protein WCJ64_26485 [Rhodospirillaceae bacterium]